MEGASRDEGGSGYGGGAPSICYEDGERDIAVPDLRLEIWLAAIVRTMLRIEDQAK